MQVFATGNKMKIKLDFEIYPYGKVIDMLKKKENKSKKHFISIYTIPKTFEEVPLSSLEGYFIVFSDKSLDPGMTEYFSAFIPQYHVERNKMSTLEKRFNGKFFPFRD
jgi:hypothetical protein